MGKTQCPAVVWPSRPRVILHSSQRKSVSGKGARRTVLGGAALAQGAAPFRTPKTKDTSGCRKASTEGRGELFQQQERFPLTDSRSKVRSRMALQMFLGAGR